MKQIYYHPGFQQKIIDALASLGKVTVEAFDHGDVLGVRLSSPGLQCAGRYPAEMSADDIAADMKRIAGGELTQHCIAPNTPAPSAP